ncbi:type III-B CRISPR module RAMP protein Cmr6 [Saccharolobus islandicus]|nr:type III-B CRISPR module RAMP protein Cmr6 [Sulfolobus islandicus]
MSILRLYFNNKASEKKLDDFENLPIAEIYKNYIIFENNQEQRYYIKDIYNLKKRQIAELLSINYKPNFYELRNATNNTKEILEKLKYSLIDIKIKTSSKTFIGVSTQFGFTIFESGISFDPIFNAPYIPASEIKGILRSLVKEEQDMKLAEKLFGTENNEGILMITDAYPISAEHSIFLPEIITPHYTSEVKQETEVNPNPVILLAIAPGVTFEFLVYYKNQSLDDKEKEIIKNLIFKMSKEGIGAKTTLGFSQFKVSEISWSVGN